MSCQLKVKNSNFEGWPKENLAGMQGKYESNELNQLFEGFFSHNHERVHNI